MKMIRLNSLFAILIAIVMLSSCKKDEEAAKDDSGYIKPTTSSAQIVKVPTAISSNTTDQNVMMINSYAQMVNAFGSYSQMLSAVPAGAEKTSIKSTGTSWHWSYTYQQTTIDYWLEMYEEDLGTRWKLYIQGAGYTTKTLVVEAYENLTHLEGSLKIYAPDQVAACVTYNWVKVGSDVSVTLLFSYQGESLFFAFDANEDGSGDMKVYYGSTAAATKIVDITWNANGHGTWWVKNPDNGATANGTF